MSNMLNDETARQQGQGQEPDPAASEAAVGAILSTVPGADRMSGTILGQWVDSGDDSFANLRAIAERTVAANPAAPEPQQQQAPRPVTVTGGSPSFATGSGSDSDHADALREALARRDMAEYTRLKMARPDISVRRRITGTTNYRV